MLEKLRWQDFRDGHYMSQHQELYQTAKLKIMFEQYSLGKNLKLSGWDFQQIHVGCWFASKQDVTHS